MSGAMDRHGNTLMLFCYKNCLVLIVACGQWSGVVMLECHIVAMLVKEMEKMWLFAVFDVSLSGEILSDSHKIITLWRSLAVCNF